MAVKYHYNQFPPSLTLDREIHQLVNQARTALGKYDGFLSFLPNSETLLSPLFVHEAVMSSKIEGTQSTLTEVLEFEGREGEQKGLSESRKQDLQEVLNYRFSLNLAIKQLQNNELPLSQRLLKNMHRELMRDVRGQHNAPGAYRKLPVWIGTGNIETARFIPIEAPHINKAMSDFERYVHHNDEYDDCIKIAILHAEFEAIHPFLDGNGRLGRMFIPLYLYDKGLISFPSFYISSYFEQYRDHYYDLLLHVSQHGDWLSWCKFFIRGVLEQATNNLKRARKILGYYNELKEQIPTLTKSQYGIVALDFIFQCNYFKSTKFFREAKIPRPTAQRLLQVFVKENILECAHGQGRQANFYVFRKLIDIADGK